MVPCGSALEAAERESRSSFDHTAELQIPSNDRQRLEKHGNLPFGKVDMFSILVGGGFKYFSDPS